MQAGYGVILTEQRRSTAALESLAAELESMDPMKSRVVTFLGDLENPAEGVEVLHKNITRRGCDVALLLVASDQFAYTGPFMSQPPANLDRMLALNCGATSALCRLFGADMAAAGRGRILLVGAPSGESNGLAGASAFGASMAFVRSLAYGLAQELAPTGVGVSLLVSAGLGREVSLADALSSTCVRFLASGLEQELPGDKVTQVTLPTQPAAPPMTEEEVSEAKRLEAERTPTPPDLDALSDDAWTQAYAQLASERNFTVLPFGAEIDRLQRSSPAELSNALLVGFAVTVYAFQRTPSWRLSLFTETVLEDIAQLCCVAFCLDYLGRWWSRGLRLDYLLTPAMIFDFVSVLPFLLQPLFSEMTDNQLVFIKLLRVLRIYRFFRPRGFRDAIQLFLPGVSSNFAETFLGDVRPWQLQVIRTFGAVFTLVFITAGLVYEAEHKTNPEFQDFGAAIYFSVISLSTVGFGDMAPITAAGRAAISVSVIVGLIVVPYQATLVSTAFDEETRLREEEKAAAEAAGAEDILASLERTRAQLAWDAARIAELEDMERADQERIAELELKAKKESGG